MHLPRNLSLTGAVLTLTLSPVARGDITAIGPFSGDLHEPLNFASMQIVARLPIFGGAAALSSFDGQSTAIHLLVNDTFIGDLVTPRTGSFILGFTQGPGIFEFNPPVRRFGGYWNNNSGTDDATVDFFGAGGEALGTRTATTPFAGNVWVWNGWESDVGIARMVVTGNGIIDGFLWFDDMELAYVPGPGAGVLVVMGAVVGGRRRRGCWAMRG